MADANVGGPARVVTEQFAAARAIFDEEKAKFYEKTAPERQAMEDAHEAYNKKHGKAIEAYKAMKAEFRATRLAWRKGEL